MEIQDVLARAYGVDGEPLITEVHPKDEMMAHSLRRHDNDPVQSLQQYLSVGHVGFSILNRILRWAGRSWSESNAVLDFASGFGRLSRFLLQGLPPERIWVSEIQEHAVPFQMETFGFRGIQSHTDPEDVSFPCSYDFISVISLFTHLPEPTFKTWMRKLGGALKEGGIMMFTTRGSTFLEARGRPPNEPFFFAPASESTALGPEEYGTLDCLPSYVEDLVRTIPGLDILGLVEEGLGKQDVFVVGRNCPRPTTPLELRENPIGSIDRVEHMPGGTARISGWALDGTDLQPLSRVRVLADGRVLGDATLLGERPDVPQELGNQTSSQGGWSITVPIPGQLPDWICSVSEDRHGLTAVRCRSVRDLLAEP